MTIDPFWKRFALLFITFVSIILIAVLDIDFPLNNDHTDIHKFHLNMSKNHRHPRSTRVFCFILTTPSYFLTRAKAVNATWAPRCDRYFFITEYPRKTMPLDQLKFADQIPIAPIKNITPGYDHLTQKSNLAFLFAYENYINDFDWFVKADDDTYLIVEHLKAFLSEQNASEPVTFGYDFKIAVPQGFHSGGASYVLSQESLRRFHEAHHDPTFNCRKDGGVGEDVEIARCLRRKGVYPGKSLDKKNRERFHPLTFSSHFAGSELPALRSTSKNAPQYNYNCCSDQTISFHYVKPEEQYLIDFLLYRVRSTLYTELEFINKLNRFKIPVK